MLIIHFYNTLNDYIQLLIENCSFCIYSETVLITACAGGAGLACLDLAINVFGAKVRR